MLFIWLQWNKSYAVGHPALVLPAAFAWTGGFGGHQSWQTKREGFLRSARERLAVVQVGRYPEVEKRGPLAWQSCTKGFRAQSICIIHSTFVSPLCTELNLARARTERCEALALRKAP